MEQAKQNEPCKVTLSITLDYQYQILQELIILQNCMLILCKGLDLYLIISNLLFVLSIGNNNKKPFILIINSDANLDDQISNNFKELILNNSNNKFIKNLNLPIKKSTVPVTKRDKFYEEFYTNGGLVSISSTVLIVDILNGTIDLNKVTGLFIINADLLIEQPFNNIVFIIEHFKKENSWGFVKCVSENVNNFNNLDQPLVTASKIFFIDRFLIYPRFHETIMNDLNYVNDSSGSSLIEVKIPPTKLMLTLQHAISDLINKCINELIVSIKHLKNTDPSLNFINDFQEEKTILIQTRHHSDNLDPELKDKIKNSIKLNYLNDNFLKYLSMKLEPFDHLLSPTSRILRRDITQLREFIFQIYSLDAVEFYKRLKQVIEMSQNNEQTSLWISTQERNTIVNTAKKRLIDPSAEDKYFLEVQPKWIQLKKILKECEDDKKEKNDDSPILIMCEETRIVNQIKKIIAAKDLKSYMMRKLASFLKEEKMIKMATNALSKPMRPDEDIQLSTTFTKNPLNVQNKIRNDTNNRRRERTAESIKRVEKLWNMNGDGDIEITNVTVQDINRVNKDAFAETATNNDKFDDITMKQAELSFLKPDDTIVVCKYGSDEAQNVLNSLQPRYIILYEANLEFIRKLDLYKQIHFNTKIFMFYYRDTIEEQSHLTQLKREKRAFVKLLKEKNNIPKFFRDYTSQNLRTDQDGIAGDISSFEHIVKEKNFRNASKNSNRLLEQPHKILVDTREFRSPLPGLLSRLGDIKVEPAFLTVGDYILTPEIAVERKSIPDLTTSLNGGRLKAQLKSMHQHYKRVVLLIEFQFGDRFKLQEGGNNKLMDDLCQLLMQLPFVRVVWSSSPVQTVNIFLSLKKGQVQPDSEEAILKGKSVAAKAVRAKQSAQSKLFLDDEDVVNEPAELETVDQAVDLDEEEDGDSKIDIKMVIYNLVEISQLQAADIVKHFKTWERLVNNLDELDNVIDGDPEVTQKIKTKIRDLAES